MTLNGVVEDPGTGTRVIFRKTARDTEGRAVVVEMFLAPRAGKTASHVHPRQEERIDVLHGSVAFQIGRRVAVARQGQRIILPRGDSHAVWNAGEEPAHIVCELRPALQFESFLRATLESPPRRPIDRVLHAATIVNAHFETVRLPFPPAPIQRVGLSAMAAIARLLSP